MLTQGDSMKIFLRLATLYLASCLVALAAVFLIPEAKIFESKVLLASHALNQILGIILTLSGLLAVWKYFLEQRHKKLYWQALSAETQYFLKTFAKADPRIQNAILRILEIHDVGIADEVFEAFFRTGQTPPSRYRKSTSNDDRSVS